jgi:hypothetical protein
VSTRHRKPCPHCGRSAHTGMALERLIAAFVNRGVGALIFVLRAPAEAPAPH